MRRSDIICASAIVVVQARTRLTGRERDAARRSPAPKLRLRLGADAGAGGGTPPAWCVPVEKRRIGPHAAARAGRRGASPEDTLTGASAGGAPLNARLSTLMIPVPALVPPLRVWAADPADARSLVVCSCLSDEP